MNRLELIKKLQNKLPEFTAKEVDAGVKYTFQLMAKYLIEGKRIEMRGFAAFSIRNRLARTSHNPITKEKVHVPAKRVIHFKPGKELKERVNKRSDTHA